LLIFFEIVYHQTMVVKKYFFDERV